MQKHSKYLLECLDEDQVVKGCLNIYEMSQKYLGTKMYHETSKPLNRQKSLKPLLRNNTIGQSRAYLW